MQPRNLIEFLGKIEKLKCNTRHSWTSSGRQESVAEHSWRLAVMAMLAEGEYPELDMNRVIRMCLIHDLGEAVTGDIPAFYKTEADEVREAEALEELIGGLPEDTAAEFRALLAEMAARETPEARLFKALDNMECLISHNEADLSTWLPREHTLNQSYGKENAAFSPWTRALWEEILQDTRSKIGWEE